MNYEIGDTITYRAFGGEMRIVRVTEKHEEVKNGKPGFTGESIHGGEWSAVWGYDDQITRVHGNPTAPPNAGLRQLDFSNQDENLPSIERVFKAAHAHGVDRITENAQDHPFVWVRGFNFPSEMEAEEFDLDLFNEGLEVLVKKTGMAGRRLVTGWASWTS